MVSRVVAVVATVLLLFSGFATASAGPPAQPPAPDNLSMRLSSGTTLAAGGWTNGSALELRFAVTVTGSALTPQVEVEPSAIPFTGTPTASSAPLTASGTAVVPITGLQDGSYHWQARLVSDAGAGPWAAFGTGGVDFGIDTAAPSRPILSSPTDPVQRHWYNNAVIIVRWSSKDALSGVTGYTYVLERAPHVIPAATPVNAPGIKLSNLSDGRWWVAVRSVDRAGNWSPTATFGIQLDRHAPQIQFLSPQRFTFDPYKGPTTVQLRPNKIIHLTLGLYRVGTYAPVATYAFHHVAKGQILSITLSGKDARGNILPRGYYFFSAVATDHAGNVLRTTLGGIDLTPVKPTVTESGQYVWPDGGKVIIVSLSRQKLYAYDGTRLVLTTLVTTGNPNLPTPQGTYSIMAKYHPYEFISPWPEGSPYYYPPSWSQYAMLFRDGGYFLHDAPWRSVFGPGSNGPGQPGTNYGGTHGCVNIPPDATLFLWNWAPIGTQVLVVP